MTLPQEEPTGDQLSSTTSEFRALVVDLLELELQAAQVRWNITGPELRTLRREIDALQRVARQWADALADRCVELGEPVWVGGLSPQVGSPERGFIDGADAADLVRERIRRVTDRARQRLARIHDPIGGQMVHEAARRLETRGASLGVDRSPGSGPVSHPPAKTLGGSAS